MDLSTLLPMAALLLVIGAGAGALAGFLGVGGGIALVPAYFHAFSALGFETPDLMRLCVATSLAAIVVTSLRSCSRTRAARRSSGACCAAGRRGSPSARWRGC